jgi:hypothetical protein
MADKEKLDELIVQIRKLLKLTDEIYERDIYPVSFFSQAYDGTNKIQEFLKEIEAAQITLFEKHIKEHQAQIFSTPFRQDNKQGVGERTETPTGKTAPDVHKQEAPPILPPPPPPIVQTESVSNPQTTADLKKWLTLNDRFRFSRELFGGNETLMNQTLADLSRINSYDQGISYLKSRFNWDFDDEAVTGFLAILEKCLNR